MKKLTLSVALGAMLIAGGVAVAQTQGDGPRGHRLAAMGDANGDGTLTKAELTAALDTRFAKMDLNKDGQVTKEERDALRQQRIDARFAALDADKNGQLSKAEFAAGREGRKGKGPEAGERGSEGPGKHMGRGHHRGHGKMGMMGMGRGADANRDGTLTKAEFTAPALAMFDRADTNKDGSVTATEQQAARAAMKTEMKAKWEARKAAKTAPQN